MWNVLRSPYPAGPPTITVLAPTAGAVWTHGENRTIGWSHGGLPPAPTFNVKFKKSPAGSWTTIASGVSGPSFDWNPIAAGALSSAAVAAVVRVELASDTNIYGDSAGFRLFGSLVTSLVHFTNLDEVSNGSAPVTRLAAVGNNWTDNNTTPSAAGKIGNAINPDRSVNEYLSTTRVTLGSTWTLAMFARPGVGYSQIFLIGDGWTANQWNRIFWDCRPVTGWIRLSTTTNSTLSWTEASGALVWRHLIFSGDGANANLHFDGTALGLRSLGATPNLSYRHLANGGSGNGSEGYLGQIDELAAWTRVLDANEIAALYNAGSGRTHPFEE